MDIEIKLDSTCNETKIIIYAKEMTPEISELVKKLSNDNPSTLIGYKENEIIPLNFEEILRIYSESQKIFVETEKDIYRLKYRLYELEDILTSTKLIRISNSEIVNFAKVESLDMSINGTITLKFKKGGKSYVSRRYIDKIKKYIGI